LGVQLVAQLLAFEQPRLLGQALGEPATQLPDPSQVLGVNIAFEQVDPQEVPVGYTQAPALLQAVAPQVPAVLQAVVQQWRPRQMPLTQASLLLQVVPAPCLGRQAPPLQNAVGMQSVSPEQVSLHTGPPHL
jgi:hypothetical protein